MELNQHTTEIKKYLAERGWDTLRPTDIIKSLVIESAEILEIFQWENLNIEEVKRRPETMAKVEDELADVFIYAFDLCALLDLDAEKLILKKLDKIRKKYPAHLMKKHDTNSGDLSDYHKIKQAYRNKKGAKSFK